MRYILIFLLLFLTNCSKIEYESFSYERVSYAGDLLSFNGYYYCKIKEDAYSINVFYRDGKMLGFGVSIDDEDVFAELDKNVAEYDDRNYNEKFDWGLYLVNDSLISIEMHDIYDLDVLSRSVGTFFRDGIILNDTTILIKKERDDTNINEVNKKYFFRKFQSKPDSTNILID